MLIVANGQASGTACSASAHRHGAPSSRDPERGRGV